jgi:hypothetical protein
MQGQMPALPTQSFSSSFAPYGLNLLSNISPKGTIINISNNKITIKH